MPANAMRFASIAMQWCSHVGARDIFPMRHRLQMRWLNACAVLADMINLTSFWDGADMNKKRGSMS